MPLIKPDSWLGKFLNGLYNFLVAMKNVGLFKWGRKPEDLQPGVRDKREGK